MVKVCDTVTLDEVLAAAAVRAASLVPETSGYLVLAVGDATARLPFRVEDAAVTLTIEGSVVVARGAQVVPPAESARVLRDMLARLLARSVGTMPGVAAAARPREQERDAEAVIAELEAALVPVNRAAARRALARLARETLRAKESGKLRRRAPAAAARVAARALPRVEEALPARLATPEPPRAAMPLPAAETPLPPRMQTPAPPRMQTPLPARTQAPPPLRMQAPPPPRVPTPPAAPTVETPSTAPVKVKAELPTPIVGIEVLRVIDVAGMESEGATVAEPLVFDDEPCPPLAEVVEVATNVDWLEHPSRRAIAETGMDAAAMVLAAGATPSPVDADELDAGWPEPSVPLLLRTPWRSPPVTAVAAEEEIEIEVSFTESPPAPELLAAARTPSPAPSVTTPSPAPSAATPAPPMSTPPPVVCAETQSPRPVQAAWAAPPPPAPPAPQPLPVDVVVWATSPTPPPLQPPTITPWSAPVLSPATPLTPPSVHATPCDSAAKVVVTLDTPSPLTASLVAGTASPARAVVPASPTPTTVGTAWSELELDVSASVPRPPEVIARDADEEPLEPPTASAPPAVVVASPEAPRVVMQGMHASRGSDRRSTLRRSADVDEVIGEAPRRPLLPSQARLDPAPRSNVEDLLSSFAGSSLSDDRAVRAIAAGLKSLAGLEPTPAPLATRAMACEPTPAPPVARREAVAPMAVAPEPSSRPRGFAVPLMVLVLALVTSSILWAYPDLLGSAEPAAQASPRR